MHRKSQAQMQRELEACTIHTLILFLLLSLSLVVLFKAKLLQTFSLPGCFLLRQT